MLPSGAVHDRVRVLGYDADHDLVVLELSGVELPALSLGESDRVRPGQRIITLGSPLGLAHTVTEGIVSGVRTLPSGMKAIQIDAAVSPGSSGGPVLDRRGRVVGVVSTQIAEGEGISFAVPASHLGELLTRERPIVLAELAAELRGRPNLFAWSVSAGDALSGRWKSLYSGETIFLKRDGDYLYGEIPADPGSTYELVRQEDGSYAGVFRHSWSCRVPGRIPYLENSCRFEDPVELRLTSPARVEGTVRSREIPRRDTRAFVRFCKRCGEGSEAGPTEFVWFKPD
jgi:hypothetical protein